MAISTVYNKAFRKSTLFVHKLLFYLCVELDLLLLCVAFILCLPLFVYCLLRLLTIFTCCQLGE